MDQVLAGAGTVNGLNLFAFNLNDQINAMGNQVSLESAYDLSPPLSKRYTKKDRTWKIITVIALLVLAVVGVALAIYTGGTSLAVSGASILGIIGITLTIVGGAITILNAAASVSEAFSCHGYNFMRDGLCGGNAKAYRALAITAAVMMVVGGIMSSINMSNAQSAAKAQESLNGTKCFIGGTLVLTKEGNKKIEDIKEGDLVWAYDEETDKSDWKEVVQLFRNVSSFATSVEIQADDGTVDKLVSTPGHKYYLPFNEGCRDANERLEHVGYVELSDKWVSAKDLKKGDKVVLASADSLTGKPKYGIVVDIKTEECEEFTTYNFEVEDFHTYYVGKNGVCTHNRNCSLDFKSGKSLDKHFRDHGKAMGYETADDYLQGARNFLDGPKAAGTQSFTSAQGTYFQYNPATNQFGIINSYGGISTYYMPDTGSAYWLQQIALYMP